MWELEHKEGWALNNWCFWTVVLEKTLESPLDSKEIKPVDPKGNQPWIIIRRTDAETEAPILWPPEAKSWLIRKDPDAGKDWRQEEKRMTEDEMVGWHHWLDGHEFEQALGDNEGQGRLMYCIPWGCKELDITEQLNNNKFIGRTDAEAEALTLWPPNAKSWLTGKDLDTGKDWGQEEKRKADDEMVGQHHQLNGHKFEQILGDSEEQRNLVCCSPWGCRVGHNLATEQLKEKQKNHKEGGGREGWGS